MILRGNIENVMAKPRHVKVTHGDIKLSRFPKEIANEFEVYVSKFKAAEEIILPYKAVGLREISPRQFEVVVVGYNSETKQAEVQEIKIISETRAEAEMKFKMEIVKQGLL